MSSSLYIKVLLKQKKKISYQKFASLVAEFQDQLATHYSIKSQVTFDPKNNEHKQITIQDLIFKDLMLLDISDYENVILFTEDFFMSVGYFSSVRISLS